MRRLALLPALLIALTACDEKATEPITVTAVTVTPATAQLASGAQLQLQVQITGSNGAPLTDRSISWASSDPELAQVSASGLVTGGRNLSNESASVTITATVEGTSGAAALELLRVPVTSIEFSKASLRLAESDTTELTVTLKTADGTELPNREARWQIADTTVLKRLDDGRLVATPYTGDDDRQTTLTVSVDSAEASLEAQVYVDWDRWTTFWEEVPDAFPDYTPYVTWFPDERGAGMTSPIAIDIDADGLNDLVTHIWSPGAFDPVTRESGGYYEGPVIDRLLVYRQDSLGRFLDATLDVFGTSAPDLGGVAVRNWVTADFNNDGLTDVVYATNREDGRWPINGCRRGTCNRRAQSAAIMSVGPGQYRTLRFGEPGWHHGISLGRVNGQLTVFSEYDDYVWNGSTFDTIPGFPLRGTGWHAYSSLPSGETEHFITDRYEGARNPSSMRLYSNLGGEWRQTDQWDWDNWRTVLGTQYDTPDWSETTMAEYRGRWFGQGAFQDYCSIRLSPEARPLMYVRVAAEEVFGDDIYADSIYNLRTVPTSLHLFYEVAGGRFEKVEGVVQPDDIVYGNSNFFDCRDVNGDDYEDLVHYQYWWWTRTPVDLGDARPHVFLNDQNGSLVRMNPDRLPRERSDDQWSSLLFDFDGDGLEDLVYFPGNGCSFDRGPTECNQWQLYRARRRLR